MGLAPKFKFRKVQLVLENLLMNFGSRFYRLKTRFSGETEKVHWKNFFGFSISRFPFNIFLWKHLMVPRTLPYQQFIYLSSGYLFPIANSNTTTTMLSAIAKITLASARLVEEV